MQFYCIEGVWGGPKTSQYLVWPPFASCSATHRLSFHCYADDTQVYLPAKINSVGFESLMACLMDVDLACLVDFKMLVLVYKSRNGLAPTYLCELLTEYQPIRSLRSSNQDLLSTPKSRLKCRGDRAFCIAAPRRWDALPLSIRQTSSVNIFKSRLKTFLFSKAYGWWHFWSWN